MILCWPSLSVPFYSNRESKVKHLSWSLTIYFKLKLFGFTIFYRRLSKCCYNKKVLELTFIKIDLFVPIMLVKLTTLQIFKEMSNDHRRLECESDIGMQEKVLKSVVVNGEGLFLTAQKKSLNFQFIVFLMGNIFPCFQSTEKTITIYVKEFDFKSVFNTWMC